jgi:eukaryotic-like serine/threonine-protein kinase
MKRIAFALLSLLLVSSGYSSSATGMDGQAAPVYRGDPAHTGYYPGGLAGQGPEGMESMLFVTTQPVDSQEIPSFLLALNAKDGAMVWRRALAGRLTSPTVAAGLVLVGSSEGGVTAYTVATGDAQWTYKTKAGVIGQPVVTEGTAYFGGGEDHAIHAVSLEKGKKVWKKKIKGEGVYSPVRIEGEALYAFSATHHAAPVLYALEVARGKQIWKKEKLEVTPLTGPNDFELAGELLITSLTPSRYRKKNDTTNYLCAFNAADGEEAWRAETGTLACFAPTVSKGTVVCYARPNDAEPGDFKLDLLAFSAEDGKELWRKEVGKSRLRLVFASPVISQGLVCAATATQTIAYDVETGERFWDNPTRNAVITAGRGQLYLASAGGLLVSVDPRGGRPRWNTKLQPLEEKPARGPTCPGEIAPPSLAD